MADVIPMQPRTTTKGFLRSQALYLVAEALYRTHKLLPYGELVDLHPVEAQKYHGAAEVALAMVEKK